VKSLKSFIDIISNDKINKLLNIDGIGQTQINSLKNFFSDKTNIKVLLDLDKILNINLQTVNKNGVLKDKTFMFTGKLEGISRAEAKSLIEKNSGTTLSSVSKNLDFVVIGQKPTKRKIDQAKALGVQIISQNELKKLID
jgi:DNA ligase (NAD+)